MIIDNKLVVSRKRKVDLIAELQQKGFKAITKVVEKSQDLAPNPDNDEDAEEEVVSGASSYDYLLGVSSRLIWCDKL